MPHSAVISVGLSGCSNQSPAIVLTDKAKIPAFLLLCSYYKPRITHGVVPKTKATLQEPFGLDMDGTELLVRWKKGCPYLCYIVLKPELSKTSGCLLCLNWICNLSFSPQGIVHVLLVFSGDSSTLEPFSPFQLINFIFERNKE